MDNPLHYRPINCGHYDYLEAAAVKKHPCKIVFMNEHNGQETVYDRIKTIEIDDGEEFLVLENGLTIRLDKILFFNDLDFGSVKTSG
ncbi:Rho-binding antiterminator [Rapidithrix thailandica]|uniref:Rho-binding antiterminator n=1 Tax=Rapidithrix thailandica TaxID=413964 RepID=A0AAW9RU45_9BACT